MLIQKVLKRKKSLGLSGSIPSLQSILLVGCGGFGGSVCRLLVSRFMLQNFPAAVLPFGTLSVNLLGCFLIGILAAHISTYESNRLSYELFLITGFLGGFTTFSAFSLELLGMLRRSDISPLIIYVLLSVLGGLLLTYLGWSITSRSPTHSV